MTDVFKMVQEDEVVGEVEAGPRGMVVGMGGQRMVPSVYRTRRFIGNPVLTNAALHQVGLKGDSHRLVSYSQLTLVHTLRSHGS